MTVVMMAALAMITFVSFAVVGLGGLYVARARAQTAADAAALAAAVSTYPPASSLGPKLAAGRAALENGTSLVVCRCPVDSSLQVRVVEVVTMVTSEVPVFGRLEVRAASRAEFDPMRWLGA